MQETVPRFNRGNLIWRDVLCHSNREFRKKLVLETNRVAYDSYGIELLCSRIKDLRVVDTIGEHEIFDVDVENELTPVQKVCHHTSHIPDGTAQDPLYFPRPTGAPVSIVRVNERRDYSYFLSLAQKVLVRGSFRTLCIKDRATGIISMKEILDTYFRVDITNKYVMFLVKIYYIYCMYIL